MMEWVAVLLGRGQREPTEVGVEEGSLWARVEDGRPLGDMGRGIVAWRGGDSGHMILS